MKGSKEEKQKPNGLFSCHETKQNTEPVNPRNKIWKGLALMLKISKFGHPSSTGTQTKKYIQQS